MNYTNFKTIIITKFDILYIGIGILYWSRYLIEYIYNNNYYPIAKHVFSIIIFFIP